MRNPNKYRKSLFLAFLTIISLSSGLAQSDLLKIEDCFNPKFYPKKIYDMQWVGNSNKISYSFNNKLFIQDVYSLRVDSSLDVADINKGYTEEKLNLKSIPNLHWIDETSFWFIHNNKLFSYDIVTKTTYYRRTIDNNDAIEIHEQTLNTAYVHNNNLWISNAAGQKQLTYDGGNGIVYGQAVHRNEFGINKGMFWSNDGYKIAFYRMDERRVSDIKQLNISTVPAGVDSFKYPFAGDSSHTVTVGVYNSLTDQITYLQTNSNYDEYLTNIAWDAEDKMVYIAHVNRDQNRMDLKRYNSEDGKYRGTLITETNIKYVEPENPPLFLSNGDGFLWQSEKDGYNHIYWFNKNGKEIQITKGNWAVTEIVSLDNTEHGVYFMSTQASPLEKQMYFAPLKDNNTYFKIITLGKGTHVTKINGNKTLFIDDFTSTRIPRVYSVFKLDGTAINTIFTAPNPLVNLNLGRVNIKPILKNNISYYTRTFLPPNYSPENKYPAIVYVYGGPHAQMITESWMGGANLWFYFMAQNGYIVYTLDNRGSANRGFDFESAIHRQLGTLEMEDQLFGLEQLKKTYSVDENRIGVHGWSFGGFMTTTLMSKNPGVFKAGVAGGPVIDWKMYEIMYTERYMDMPQQNPEGYKNANLLNFAQNLNNRLLMIHGMDDDVVIWQHSQLYLDKMIKLGNDNLDYFFYPGHKHNVLGKDRAHLYKKISQYFFDHL